MKHTGMTRRHRWVAALTTTLMVITAAQALAATTIDAGDGVVLGTADAYPGVTLVRGGTGTFSVRVTADDGNISQDDFDKFGVTVAKNFTISTTDGDASMSHSRLTDSPADTQQFTAGIKPREATAMHLDFTGRVLTAAETAKLGRTLYPVTFGGAHESWEAAGSSTAVYLGNEIEKGSGFTNPSVYVTVNPRPVTAPASPTPAAVPGNALITLNWTKSPDDAELADYKIYQRSGTEEPYAYTLVDAVAKGSESTVMTGLTNGTDYCFAIGARFNDGTMDFFSALSADACATPEASSVADPIATFKQPIDGNMINIAKAGRTIPVKVTIDVGDEATGSGFVSFTRTKIDCSTGGTLSDAVESYTTGSSNTGNQFRWDESGPHWIFNFNTSGLAANSCHLIKVFVGGSVDDNGIISGGSEAGSFTLKITK